MAMIKVNDPIGKKAKLINFKISPKLYKQFRVKAKRFTGGNVSQWLRYAGAHLNARPQDLTHRRPVRVVQTTKVISIARARKTKTAKAATLTKRRGTVTTRRKRAA